jgi:tetratricopeptide (TPR) repeat protein
MKTKAIIRKTFIATVCSVGILNASLSQAGQTEINQIESAASQLDVMQLQRYSTDMLGYEKGLAQYRLALSANLLQKSDVAEKAIDGAMATLEALEQQETDNVEIKALLAQVYGYKIALSPLKGAYYGPKSQTKLSEAEQLAPENPRVQLIKGIDALNTPALFGGSMERAMNAFDKSISAYENDQYSNYYWGHAEAYTWKGLMLQREGHNDKAIAQWKKALVVDPDYGWAKNLLTKSN